MSFMTSEYITRGEAAAILGVSERTVNRYIEIGVLTRYETLMNRLRLAREEVEHLASNRRSVRRS